MRGGVGSLRSPSTQTASSDIATLEKYASACSVRGAGIETAFAMLAVAKSRRPTFLSMPASATFEPRAAIRAEPWKLPPRVRLMTSVTFPVGGSMTVTFVSSGPLETSTLPGVASELGGLSIEQG